MEETKKSVGRPVNEYKLRRNPFTNELSRMPVAEYNKLVRNYKEIQEIVKPVLRKRAIDVKLKGEEYQTIKNYCETIGIDMSTFVRSTILERINQNQTKLIPIEPK